MGFSPLEDARARAVDDVPVGSLHAKGIHDGVYYLLIVAQLEVVAFLLAVGLLVGYEVTLEGGHLAFVKQGAVGAAPQVEEVVYGILPLLGVGVCLESRAHHHAYVMHQLPSAIYPAGVNGDGLQRAVIVERARGVEEQVVVDHGIHAAVL